MTLERKTAWLYVDSAVAEVDSCSVTAAQWLSVDCGTTSAFPAWPVQGNQKPCNEEDAAIRAKLEDALKSTGMLNFEKHMLEFQLEDERRRQEWLSQREQRERDELYTELREMLSGLQRTTWFGEPHHFVS